MDSNERVMTIDNARVEEVKKERDGVKIDAEDSYLFIETRNSKLR